MKKSLPVILGILLSSIVRATVFIDVQISPNPVGLYKRLEIRFRVDTQYANPYDPAEVAVNGCFTSPSGAMQTVPAFWFQNYRRSLVNGQEQLFAQDNPLWCIRFTPMETGTYTFFLDAIDATGHSVSSEFTFEAEGSDNRGFIRVDPGDSRFLSFDDGSFYLPRGQNVGWGTNRGTYDYDTYMPPMSDAGENWIRIWCTVFYKGQILEWREDNWTGWYHGLGKYSQQGAWKWDYMVERAEDLGLYIQMVTQHHGQFSQSVNANWDDNPYNAANGGFLDSGDQFFSDPQAKELYKRKMRYTVARWGYSTAILAWELFNEVQFTDNYETNYPVVADWHQEMASFIHSIDPWKHLVTTSARDGDSLIWSAPDLDLTQNHYYGPGVLEAVRYRHLMMKKYGKPNIVGEFGDNWETGGEDPSGTVIHQGIWTAAMSGGGAMPWWWDNYIHPYNLYDHWSALSSFWDGEDLRIGRFETVPVACAGGPESASGFRLYPGKSWEASTCHEFWVQKDGTTPGIENLSQFIQGSDKAWMGREAVFHTDFPDSIAFGTFVADISAWNPGILQVTLDNAASPLINLTPVPGTLYEIDVPPGNHMVRIFNAGIDWFFVTHFQLRGPGIPAARAFGLSNGETAYVWVLDRDNEAGSSPHGTVTGVSVQIDGLQAGSYRAEQFNTNTGAMVSSRTVQASDSLVLPLSGFIGDAAVKIKPSSTGVDVHGSPPGDFTLDPAYPNPFNSATRIPFRIESSARVCVTVSDVLGRPVTCLANRRFEPGMHSVSWNGRDARGRECPTGMYMVRLQSAAAVKIAKMLLLR